MKKVAIGSRVRLKFDDGNTADIILVNPHEADIFQKKISSDSPIGCAIQGKNEGDKVDYLDPKKNIISCKIIKVI